MSNTTIDMNNWGYLFSVVRGSKCGEIFVESGLSGMSEPKYLLMLRDSKEAYDAKEFDTLDDCREVAEAFVMNDYIWE